MSLLTPNWVTPNNVEAVSSTRENGVSKAPFSSFNLGMHVGDEPSDVLANRQALQIRANMPSSPVWLNQTHSTKIAIVQAATEQVLDADASFTRTPGVVLSAMTADCLPILICAKDGSAVAAVHAGWRGLADRIVEKAANLFDSEAQAWIGPAIGFDAFEVGLDVKHAFCQTNPEYSVAFKAGTNPDKWLADLAHIAQMKLQASGIRDVTLSSLCTFSDEKRFFSYRRDGQTGRMASFIWINH